MTEENKFFFVFFGSVFILKNNIGKKRKVHFAKWIKSGKFACLQEIYSNYISNLHFKYLVKSEKKLCDSVVNVFNGFITIFVNCFKCYFTIIVLKTIMITIFFFLNIGCNYFFIS